MCTEQNITLNKLAALSALRQSTLENLAKGHAKNPTLRTLHCIAVGLGITVSDLLDFPDMNDANFDDA
ncbi:MAG: helix-turn-helix transcriptional regulator [Clostridia bacterium]|nr:helix-turn-helix transcriptional regulator [Clostridia bacterium]